MPLRAISQDRARKWRPEDSARCYNFRSASQNWNIHFWDEALGEVAEWLKAPVSKTGMSFCGIGGSNPPLSAIAVSLRFALLVEQRSDKCGEVPEWLNGHAWKACVGQPTAGSNPVLSAISDQSSPDHETLLIIAVTGRHSTD